MQNQQQSTLFSGQSGITVSPFSQEIQLEPGEETVFQIEVWNEGNEVVSLQVTPVEVQLNENGEPQFVENVGQDSAIFWLDVPTPEVLPVEGKYVLSGTIQAPEEVEDGSYPLALWLQPTGAEAISRSIGSQAVVTSFLSLEVGEFSNGLELKDFEVDGWWQSGHSVNVSFSLANQSEFDLIPAGKIELVEVFTEENLPIRQTVNESSVRLFSGREETFFYTFEHPDGWWSRLGSDTISVVIDTGEQRLEQQIDVFWLPWQWVLLFAFGIIFAFISGWFGWKYWKKEKTKAVPSASVKDKAKEKKYRLK